MLAGPLMDESGRVHPIETVASDASACCSTHFSDSILSRTEMAPREFDVINFKYSVIAHVLQTLFYGAFLTLMAISTQIMLKQGIRTRARRVAFFSAIFCFAMSSIYWILSMTSVIHGYRILAISRGEFLTTSRCNIRCVVEIFDATVLVNYAFANGVIVWRAWELCKDSSKKALYVAIGLFCVTCMALLAVVMMRLVILGAEAYAFDYTHGSLSLGLYVCEVATIGLSFLTSFTATATVAVKAWCTRSFLRSASYHAASRALKLLALLVESGSLYCFSTIFVLISFFVRLPFGSLGDVWRPMNLQIAGVYPLLVIIAIDKMRLETRSPNNNSSSRQNGMKPPTTPSSGLSQGSADPSRTIVIERSLTSLPPLPDLGGLLELEERSQERNQSLDSEDPEPRSDEGLPNLPIPRIRPLPSPPYPRRPSLPYSSWQRSEPTARPDEVSTDLS